MRFLSCVTVSMLAASMLSGCVGGRGSCECRRQGKPVHIPPLATALAVDLSVPKSSARDGVQMSVAIRNKGPDPFTLQVCPAMTLCCVKGLHPVVQYDNTGKGLLDLCKEAKPVPQNTFLPGGSSFSFESVIPISCLPEPCRQKGAEFTLTLRYDISPFQAVESMPVKIVMAE